jgi:hypothetical protein
LSGLSSRGFLPDEEVEGDKSKSQIFLGVGRGGNDKLLRFQFRMVVLDVLFIVLDGLVTAQEIVFIISNLHISFCTSSSSCRVNLSNSLFIFLLVYALRACEIFLFSYEKS